MQTPTISSVARVLGWPLLALLLIGCGDSYESPNINTSLEALSGIDRPYYFYDGLPVYLDVDPYQLTVVTTGAIPEITLQESLSAVGLNKVLVERSRLDPKAFRVYLEEETSSREIIDAAVKLRTNNVYDFVANTYRAQESGEVVILHNRLIVHVDDVEGDDVVERLVNETGARILQRPSDPSAEYVLEYPPSVDPLAFSTFVARQPGITWVDPDKTAERRLQAIPNDPLFPNQYYARSTTTFNGVHVDDNVEWAWDLTYGAWSAAAGPLIVAVIDDGVQVSHPDLDSNFVLGYDSFTNSWSSLGCSDCATNPLDNPSHGTLVAGIIKAQHNNGIGLAGLAPAVRLLPIRIFRNGAPASDSQIAMAIDAAWQNGAHVISNSWGGGSPSNAITAAITRATTQGRGGRGSIVVFSGGNTSNRASGIVGPVSYPATLSNVLAVGAINRNGTLTNYAPQGSELDIVAPTGHMTGTCIGDVVTTDLMGPSGCNGAPNGDNNYSGNFSGTSAAAPQVAAVAAMVLSLNPTLSEAEIRNRITSNADPWGSTTQYGAGKLNAYRALVGRTRVSMSGPSRPSGTGSYVYQASASGGVGGYTYAWSVSYDNGPFVSICSGGTSCALYVGANADIDLQVTVKNGPDNQQVSTTKSIMGPIICSVKGTSNIVPVCP